MNNLSEFYFYDYYPTNRLKGRHTRYIAISNGQYVVRSRKYNLMHNLNCGVLG